MTGAKSDRIAGVDRVKGSDPFNVIVAPEIFDPVASESKSIAIPGVPAARLNPLKSPWYRAMLATEMLLTHSKTSKLQKISLLIVHLHQPLGIWGYGFLLHLN